MEAIPVKTGWAAQDEKKGLAAVTPVAPVALDDAVKAACASNPDAPVKVGMLPDAHAVKVVARALAGHKGMVVADPVMGPSAGGSWAMDGWVDAYLGHMAKAVDILTPNLAEARALAGDREASAAACAARLSKAGFRTVVVTGGDDKKEECADLVSTQGKSVWLVGKRLPGSARGTGCFHSTAICAAMAQGEGILDAIVIAKMLGAARVAGKEAGWPSMQLLPVLSDMQGPPLAPARKPAAPLGVCSLVDDPGKIAGLAEAGVMTFQLRVKGRGQATVKKLVRHAAALASEHNVRLFVNDHWQACCETKERGITGVHLGQDDLRNADVGAIHGKKLALGITANGWAEAASAMAASPAYISFGPVFPTRSKKTAKRAIGIDRLGLLCKGLPVQAIAIGGIDDGNVGAVAAAGVAGVAAIEACARPEGAARLVKAWERAMKATKAAATGRSQVTETARV